MRARCIGTGGIGLVSPSSLSDAYCIFRRARGEKDARTIVGKLIGLVTIVPISAEECLSSIRFDEPGFEDGSVRACAELDDVDFILMWDATAFRHPRVRSMTCRGYLDLFPQ